MQKLALNAISVAVFQENRPCLGLNRDDILSLFLVCGRPGMDRNRPVNVQYQTGEENHDLPNFFTQNFMKSSIDDFVDF